MTDFAYLVTIHNAAHCLKGTLENIYTTKSESSPVIAILDGCTDNSEPMVDAFNVLVAYDQPVIKLHAPDVHEIKSINLGLRYIRDTHLADYAITVQDDVWLLDKDLETMTIQLFHDHSRLGHLLYRMGANYDADMNLLDLVDNHCSEPSIGRTLATHQYCFRMVGSKSPSCIPLRLIDEYGLMDENLAPRGYEDIEWSLRLLEQGYRTCVLATDWRSDLSWGGTRRTQQPVTAQDEHNKQYVKQKYHNLLTSFVIPESYREVYHYGE